jgi:hypothetical protein
MGKFMKVVDEPLDFYGEGWRLPMDIILFCFAKLQMQHFFRKAADENYFFAKRLLYGYFSIHFGIYNKMPVLLCE